MSGFGLRIAGSMGLEGFSGNTASFPIDTANTNPMFVGDPVILNGGAVEAATVASAAILGIFLGWEDKGPVGVYGQKGRAFNRYWSAADGAIANAPKAKVALPPHSRFWIKGESGVTFAEATSVGAAHPFVINAGNAQFGDSRWTIGAPGAGPLIVHGLVETPGNAWGDTEPLLEVSIALQTLTFADAS